MQSLQIKFVNASIGSHVRMEMFSQKELKYFNMLLDANRINDKIT